MPGWLLFVAGILALGAIYGIITLALNFEAGLTGMLDLGIVSFVAIGAYTYVILTYPPTAAPSGSSFVFGLPMWAGLLGALLCAGLAALLIGLPTLHLGGEHFLIVTFACAQVIYQVVNNEQWLTRGTVGFHQVGRPLRAYFSSDGYEIFYALLVLTVLALVVLLLSRLHRSPFGRAQRAVRENLTVAISVGKNAYRLKLVTFVVAGVLAGLAGPLYVWYQTLIVPPMISFNVTFTAWIALALGGLGNHLGAVAGAFLLIFLRQFVSFVDVAGFSGASLGGFQVALEGLIMILVLRFRPQGLLPERPVRLPRRLEAKLAHGKGGAG